MVNRHHKNMHQSGEVPLQIQVFIQKITFGRESWKPFRMVRRNVEGAENEIWKVLSGRVSDAHPHPIKFLGSNLLSPQGSGWSQ